MRTNALGQLKSWIKRVARLIHSTLKEFGTENGSFAAAALSFYAFLSMLPALLLAVSVLGMVIGSSDRAFAQVMQFFDRFMPSSTFVADALRGLVNARGAIGWIGIAALLWTSSQFFVTLQIALNRVWKVATKPGFVASRLKAILLVLVFSAFLILSLASSAVAELLRSYQWFGITTEVTAVLLRIAAVLTGLVFAMLMFFVVYKLAPDTRVGWKSALVGALFAAIVWVIAKELYRLYLSHFANYNKLYGSIGGIVLLIMWVYYTSAVLVLGAGLTRLHERGSKEQA